MMMRSIVLIVVLSCLAATAMADCAAQKSCGDCSSLKDSHCVWCDSSSSCMAPAAVANASFTCASGICQGNACKDICTPPCDTFGLFPCSNNVVGQIFLMLIYGVILAVGAKLISDGCELLLEILDPGVIGALLLPVLGAVPDAAIIVVSGAGGTVAEAQEQLAVGVGTLAGSTVMLLTVPWVAVLFAARCDIVNGETVDETLSSTSWSRTGVTVDDDTALNSKIMIATSLSYLIVQGVAFTYLGNPDSETAKKAESGYALAGFIVCCVALVGYSIFQLMNPQLQEKRMKEAKRRAIAQTAIQHMLKRVSSRMMDSATAASPLLSKASDEPNVGAALKFGNRWKAKAKSASATNVNAAEADVQEDEEPELNAKQIAMQSTYLLVAGTALVAVFSDPMVDVITEFGNTVKIPLFYISFIVTPFCSNASELISSILLAKAKKKRITGMTYSALYGAAIMNNTLCLAIFFALICFRGLAWTFSAETLCILIITWIMGAIGMSRRTFNMWWCIPVSLCYPLSLVIVAVLEGSLHWT